MSTALTPLERACVEVIARENWPEVRLDGLRVTKRERTGVGRFVYLDDMNGQTLPDGTYGAREKTIQMEGLQYGLDFVIDVTSSRINYLELVTSDEAWDGTERAWRLT